MKSHGKTSVLLVNSGPVLHNIVYSTAAAKAELNSGQNPHRSSLNSLPWVSYGMHIMDVVGKLPYQSALLYRKCIPNLKQVCSCIWFQLTLPDDRKSPCLVLTTLYCPIKYGQFSEFEKRSQRTTLNIRFLLWVQGPMYALFCLYVL